MMKFLKAIKLFDRDGTLSLSNILLATLVVKIALAPTLDWAVTSTLALALLNYADKRYKGHAAQKAHTQELNNNNKLETRVDELAQQVNIALMNRHG
jgi:hypothetical protein